MHYTHFVSVAGFVTNAQGDILLVNSPRRGWEYPGGMVEPGETLEDALLREIREESGIEAEIVGFIGLCKNIEKDVVNIDFACRPSAAALQPATRAPTCGGSGRKTLCRWSPFR